MIPISVMVMSMPVANVVDKPTDRRARAGPCFTIYPTTSGMLARWHGLSSMLATPHPNDAASAIPNLPDIAIVRVVKSSSSIVSFPR